MRRAITTRNVAYRTPGAFLPPMIPTPLASSYGLTRISGGPTATAPAPAPAALLPQAASTGEPSRGAPDQIRFGTYVVRIPRSMYPPVPVRIDNDQPVQVPAPQRLPSAAPHQQRIGGTTVMAWPRTIIRWPQFGGGVS